MKEKTLASFKVTLRFLSVLVAFVYTPSALAQAPGAFIPTGNMTVPRVGHTATVLANGKVLIAGGSFERPASAELYDPLTGTFTATGDMTKPRYFHSATLLPDGRVLITAGDNLLQPTAEIYDPSTGTFSPTESLVPPILAGHMQAQSDSAPLLNTGKVLIIVTCNDVLVVDPQVYDSVARTFSVAAGNSEKGLRYSACGPATTLANGTVFIAASAELYDPISDTLRFSGHRTTVGLYGSTATLLTDGRVLAVGGDGDFGFSSNAEVYDPSTEKFTGTGNMSHDRAAHTATLLPDGTVLIAGGKVSPETAEVYDAVADKFVSTPDMVTPRVYHRATMLLDGRVLITGGYSAWLSPVPAPFSASAELFVPSVLTPSPIVKSFRLDGSEVAPGSSYSAAIAGLNLTSQTSFDVRFTSPDTNDSAVVLNWQRGLTATHSVPDGTASGNWTINGVRAHEIETDHTGDFFPVSATITVSP